MPNVPYTLEIASEDARKLSPKWKSFLKTYQQVARYINNALPFLQGEPQGFGNGAAGTAVTTTLKGTGTGPTNPQTIVSYLQVNINGTIYWIPLVQ